MLKKIPVEQLRLGMHLQAFCGPWLEHPFWRTQFVLTDPKDLALIHHGTIREVWIDVVLGDDIDDGGSAAESFRSRSGNCQTHARLYTALARTAGLPTRFVSGLVYLEDKGFLYHSWAESFIGDRWVSVDPTYNQLPADPTHLKFFEGHTQEDMAPIIAIIGRIKLRVLDTRY